MFERKIDAIWFNDVGIVKVTIDNKNHYYIGPCRAGNTEEEDKQHIANWGTKFSAIAGGILFGDISSLMYMDNVLYGKTEVLKMVQGLIMEKEMSQVRRSAQIDLSEPKLPEFGSAEFLETIKNMRKA